jgi:hypothetical protein
MILMCPEIGWVQEKLASPEAKAPQDGIDILNRLLFQAVSQLMKYSYCPVRLKVRILEHGFPHKFQSTDQFVCQAAGFSEIPVPTAAILFAKKLRIIVILQVVDN